MKVMPDGRAFWEFPAGAVIIRIVKDGSGRWWGSFKGTDPWQAGKTYWTGPYDSREEVEALRG